MTSAASIVVVTHRGVGEMVHSCLASLVDADEVPTTTIVVDNSGRPSSDAAAYGPGVDEVVRVANTGFGAAANAGVRLARRGGIAAPVVVLNDDIEVAPGWLSPLLAALDADDGLGAVQPALLRLGTDRINSVGVRLDRFGAGSDVGLDEPADALPAAGSIDMFTGGAVVFAPQFLDDTGGFDERYFLYYEDVDLALRGAERGWRYACETASRVYHHGGATTAGLGAERVRYQERNRLWTVFRFAPPAMVRRAVWLSIRKLRHEPRAAHARALVGGLAGGPGAIARRVAARRSGAGAIVSANGR